MPFLESSFSIHFISFSLKKILGFGSIQGKFFDLICKLRGKLGLFFFLCLFKNIPLSFVSTVTTVIITSFGGLS